MKKIRRGPMNHLRNFCLLTVITLGFTTIVGTGGGGGGGSSSKNNDFEAEEPFSFEVNVVNQTQLRLQGINGEIDITGIGGTNSVIITGTKRVGSYSIQDAEEHLDELEVNVQDLADEVFVETVQPQNTGDRDYVVDYTITLPSNFEVQVANVNGLITLDSINNDVAVVNVNGQVTLIEIMGSASVNVVNGEIESEVTLPLDGIIDLNAVNGNINLDVPTNTSAEFSANVTNGSINISNLVLQNEVITPTSVTGTLGNGEGEISLDTVTGSINVSGF
jgi:hypothetical protein